MSVTISIQSTNYSSIIGFIQSIEDDPSTHMPEGRSAEFFIDNILPEFGVRIANLFVLLECEYWTDYNPYYQLLRAVELYFGIEDVWYDDWETLVNHGALAEDVLGELDIEPIGSDNDY